MQFKDKLGNCLIQTVTYLSLNWSSQLSVICGGQHVPLEARDTCENIGIPLHPLRLLARLRREFRGLPLLWEYMYILKRGSLIPSAAIYNVFVQPPDEKNKNPNRVHSPARLQLRNPTSIIRVIGN